MAENHRIATANGDANDHIQLGIEAQGRERHIVWLDADIDHLIQRHFIALVPKSNPNDGGTPVGIQPTETTQDEQNGADIERALLN